MAQESAWYAEVLGAVRDLDVVGATLRAELDRLQQGPDSPLVVGDVRAWLDETLAADRERAWSRLRRVLAGSRYDRLRAELTRWAAEPDWSDQAEKVKLRRRVRKAGKRVRRRLRQAQAVYADTANTATANTDT